MHNYPELGQVVDVIIGDLVDSNSGIAMMGVKKETTLCY